MITSKIRRTLMAVLLGAVAIAPAMQAREGQTSSTTTTPPPPPMTGLQKALNLTDSQVSQLQTLMQSQHAAMQTLRTTLRTAEQTLQTALKGTDTSAIGAATVAVQSAQTALANAQKANLQALLAVLTTAQQQIINDYLLIAQNGGPGPFGFGPGGPGGRGGPRGAGPGGPPPEFRGGPRP